MGNCLFFTIFRNGHLLTPAMQAAALGSTLAIAIVGGALTGQCDAYSD